MAELRVASYNIRVDHTDDLGTPHAWTLRRPLAACSVPGERLCNRGES